ncbi:MAG: protein-glutamate O-methyltransferase CheR [Desulfobacterales bacterium]|nr:protein-glutamate O-methyltransferase CheR [Desulfobacterales bacterium]
MNHFVNEILEEIYKARGLNFNDYRNAPEKEIASRMAKLQINDPCIYLERLRTDPSECDCLIDSVSINVSSFFRNPVVFEIIAQKVLPFVIDKKTCAKTGEIRVWSAGCAAGEEACSIAILIREALGEKIIEWRPFIFATDISARALDTAKKGIYNRKSLENTKLGILDKYFIAKDDKYEVNPVIREMVSFSLDDLTSKDRFAPTESIFGTFDIVLCRNVIIYFSRDIQERLFHKLYRSMDKGGFLILGASESLNPETEARLITSDRINRIYQKP